MPTPSAVGSPSPPHVPLTAISALQHASDLFECDPDPQLIYSTAHSRVFKAESRRFGQTVAVKLLMTETIRVRDPRMVERFAFRELLVTQSFDHPHLLEALAVSVRGPTVIIVTPFCSGGNLFNLIQAKKKLTEPQAARVFRQLLEALNHLHERNVAHRDIKLENVLFTASGDVKLIDFGLVIKMKDRNQRARSPCGTHGYMAPSIKSCRPYNPFATDYYALGMVLHTMLTGKFPAAVPIKTRQLFPSSDSFAVVSALLDTPDEVRPGYKWLLGTRWMKQYASSWVFSNHPVVFFETCE
ncbi:hypothetical protein L596_009437 [Steinernema carpocapsae]|uniref:Protein kinase domain-containing protein n=1 Tax=Steinernema carpocapsae TaxID=34508 RepID=A0A4U5PFM4_STECR|nr:hypothetical protein L596_009437 [Steinernema carpocapsae]